MKFTDTNVIKAKYYNNLFTIATKLVDDCVNKPFIIASNCISLIAGLTFHLLKNYQYNYNVVYYSNKLATNYLEDKQFIIVSQSNAINLNKVTLYFFYEGTEPGILCVN